MSKSGTLTEPKHPGKLIHQEIREMQPFCIVLIISNVNPGKDCKETLMKRCF